MTSPAETPFHDLDHYVALPRLSSLTLSPDGTRLITTVATLNRKGSGYVNALWELDPTGERLAYRITRSAKGEAGPAFTPNGDLYFTSARPDPDGDDANTESALWQIPAHGGEARIVHTRPGGVGAVSTADDADLVILAAPVLPGATDETGHAALHKLRKDAEVDAILHDSYPVRFWDADIGPGRKHLFAVEPGTDDGAGTPRTVDYQSARALRDLTPNIGSQLGQGAPQLSPDGSFVLIGLVIPEGRGSQRSVLARIDVATGEREILADSEHVEYSPGPVSPDGRTAVVVGQDRSTATTAPQPRLYLLDTGTGELRPLAHEWDAWSRPAAWLPDGSAILVLADDDGRGPVFEVTVSSGEVRQITADDATYSDVVVSPDGSVGYGLRSSYAYPTEAVRIDLATGDVTELPGPATRPDLPGHLTEIETITDDGARVRAWLALPETGEPAPLLLWIHGGPLGSWNAWSWRWNPWLMVAQGYAVLLPDPALSTGYGQEFVQRGWGAWGGAPYTDLLAITDAAEVRDDIDATRTAAMGGSFGGYMANWVAGHTDRFNAIVTHASLWALDQFGPTTDASYYWAREMTAEMAMENSPHRFVEQIVTPMLVIHGDKDYRVPIGEGLRLWYELLSRSGLPAHDDGSTAHRFLYYPAENHWILGPQHAKVWYEVVLGFLSEHVLGQGGSTPASLGLTAPTAEQRAAIANDEEHAAADDAAEADEN